MNHRPTTQQREDAALDVFTWAYGYALNHFGGDNAKCEAWLKSVFEKPVVAAIHEALKRRVPQ